MLPHNFHIIHFYISFLNLSCRGNVIYLINVLQLKVSTLYSNKKKEEKELHVEQNFISLFTFFPRDTEVIRVILGLEAGGRDPALGVL